MQDNLISEEYLHREWEMKVARALKPIMFELGAWRAKEGDIGMYSWSSKKHLIHVSASHKYWNRHNMVTFSNYRYTSDSMIEYGKPVIIQDDVEKVDGFSRVIRNVNSPVPTQETIATEVTLRREVQHIFKENFTFNVENETQISGSYGGVELQNTLKLAFGTEFGTEETEAESTEAKDSYSKSFEVPAGVNIIVSLVKNKLETETPYVVRGYWDCAIELDFEDWASDDLKQGARLFKNWHKGSKKFKFNSLLEFERFLKGYDVDHIGMAGYYETASRQAHDAIDFIFNKEERFISLEGVKRRVFESNIDIDTQEAT